MAKKIKLILCSLLLVGSMIQGTEELQAADFSVGLYSYYAWWNPAFRTLYDNHEFEPLLMAGPVLSVSFAEKWTVTGSLIFNWFNPSDASYQISGTGSQGDYTIFFDSELTRTDMDLSLTYSLSQPFKIFAGFKILLIQEGGCNGEMQAEVTSPYTINNDSLKQTDIKGTGGGAGVIFVYPLGNSFFLGINTSIVFLITEFTMQNLQEISTGGLEYADDSNIDGFHYRSLGNNSTITISYYISALSSTISLGARYQVLKYFADGDSPSLPNDTFYGITMAFMYLF